MLTLKNLSLTASDAQGRTDIVKNVSLDVEDGKFLVITGPNGGGKTTLAKLIMGLATPTGGQILLDGEDITPLSITDRARRGISYSFQQPPRFKGMKVSDLLTIAAGKTLSHDEACSYLTQVGLCARDYLGRDVDTSLSGGEVKRIEIATLLAKNSRLMIFDEPEAGIDLWSFARLTETFRDLHSGIPYAARRHPRFVDHHHFPSGAHHPPGRRDRPAGKRRDRRPRHGGRALSPPAVPDRRRLQSAGGERNMLNDIQKSILQTVSDMVSIPDGAVNIRLDGQKEFRQNSEHIQIVSKTDKDGIDIRIAPFTKSENVHIPVILSKSGFHDLVYNDFFVGEGADVTIVAGCGIHNCGDCDSEHDGIHTFYIGKNAKVHYIEKHYGEGEGSGKRILNPQTIVYLEEGASIVMDTSQIGGVDDTKRYTKCEANGANSEVQINEKLLTAGDQHAVSEMDVILNGEGSRTRVVSRSVAKEASTQIFYPRVQGNAPCFGHVSCDSIIMGAAKVRSIPEISCNHVDAALMHEAAIGKIAGEQLLKLETLGLTPEEAEEKILEGFLR